MTAKLAARHSLEDFAGLEPAWNRLALEAGNPFLTHEWLRSWWGAFGEEGDIAITLSGADGSLLAGAGPLRQSGRALGPAANVHRGAWDVVASDDSSRRALWHELAARAGSRLSVPRMPAASPSVAVARDVLESAGYRVASGRHQLSPYLALPKTWEQLLETLSSNSRSQVRKKRRRIARRGQLRFRSSSGPEVDRDLDLFFRLEASGWKGEAGTAILHDPRALRLYTDFARASARRGWLRLDLLELDGVTVAADLSCVLRGAIFVMKTCFDERYAELSPGVVLRAESIRTAIEAGLDRYEWLGSADAYKLHWGGGLHESLVMSAYRGHGLPAYYYRHKLRPAAARGFRALARRAPQAGS